MRSIFPTKSFRQAFTQLQIDKLNEQLDELYKYRVLYELADYEKIADFLLGALWGLEEYIDLGDAQRHVVPPDSALEVVDESAGGSAASTEDESSDNPPW